MSDLTVSALYINAFRDFLAACGVPKPAAADPALRALHPLQRLPYDGVFDLFRRWAAELQCPDLALRFGRCVGGAGFGLLGVTAATAATLADSIDSLTTYEPLTSSVGTAELAFDGDLAVLGWRCAAPGAQGALEFSDAVLAGWVWFGQFLLGTRVTLERVELTERSRRLRGVYEDWYRCPVRIGAPRNAVVLHRDWLSYPTRFAHAQLHGALEQWSRACTGLVAMQRRPLLDQALGVLATPADGPGATLHELSERLAVKRRTLQRHLAEQALSFRSLLDSVRVTVAVSDLLTTDVPLLRIVERTGFEEQATFSRKFRGWLGMTPTEFRRFFPHTYAGVRAEAGAPT